MGIFEYTTIIWPSEASIWRISVYYLIYSPGPGIPIQVFIMPWGLLMWTQSRQFHLCQNSQVFSHSKHVLPPLIFLGNDVKHLLLSRAWQLNCCHVCISKHVDVTISGKKPLQAKVWTVVSARHGMLTFDMQTSACILLQRVYKCTLSETTVILFSSTSVINN